MARCRRSRFIDIWSRYCDIVRPWAKRSFVMPRDGSMAPHGTRVVCTNGGVSRDQGRTTQGRVADDHAIERITRPRLADCCRGHVREWQVAEPEPDLVT